METQINLTIYRLNAWSDFDKYLNVPDRSAFWKFTDNVYNELLKLRPGESIDIIKQVHPDAMDKFIKICDMFISDGHSEYGFTYDYKIQKRNELEQSPRANSRNAQSKKNTFGNRK